MEQLGQEFLAHHMTINVNVFVVFHELRHGVWICYHNTEDSEKYMEVEDQERNRCAIEAHKL